MTIPVGWQKSSFSGSGDGNACVELAATPTKWKKSSFSGGGEGNDCVELATSLPPTTLHLRESDTPTTLLTTTPTALAALLHGIRSGRLTPGLAGREC